MRTFTYHRVLINNVSHVRKLLLSIILLVLTPSIGLTNDPDCRGIDRWPTMMAIAKLKNAGITDNYRLDFTKTKTKRLASEKISKNIYRQIHHIRFTEKSGKIIEVITSNESSKEECSMSAVDVFVVSQHLKARQK